MVHTFAVEIDVPEGVTLTDVRMYVREAVVTWCKTGDPDEDPLFDLSEKDVRVYRLGAGVYKARAARKWLAPPRKTKRR